MNDSGQENEDRAFYNDWVDPDQLPKTEESAFVKLEPDYLYVRLINVFLVTITAGVTLAIFVLFSSLAWGTMFFILGGFMVLMIIWAVLIILEFKHRGYAIRSQDVAYRSGFIFRRRQYLPFRRVQHCKITEGLIERLFNLSTVIISAAGDDIVIHGLRPDVAQSLQQFVNEKVDAMTKEMHYGRD